MPEIDTDSFFIKKRTAAEIKSEILLSCFTAWYTFYLNQTSSPASSLQYVDLLAGPGCPEDCSPVNILQAIYANNESIPEVNESIQTYFFCPAKGATDKLKAHLENLTIYAELANQPVFLPDASSNNIFVTPSPTLLATDPFGTAYAQEILVKALPNTPTDLWLLFNLNKLKAALASDHEESGLPQLFGHHWEALKTYLQQETNTRKREQHSLEVLENALKDRSYYCATLRINLPGKDQLSYYLMVASKMKSLYFQLREILELYSDYQPDGVPLFQVNQKQQPAELPGFFRYLHPYCMENLVEELGKSRSRFHYRTIREVYEEHALGTPYRKLNYLQAFENLKNQGLVNLVDEKNKQVKKLDETAIVFYKLHGNK